MMHEHAEAKDALPHRPLAGSVHDFRESLLQLSCTLQTGMQQLKAACEMDLLSLTQVHATTEGTDFTVERAKAIQLRLEPSYALLKYQQQQVENSMVELSSTHVVPGLPHPSRLPPIVSTYDVPPTALPPPTAVANTAMHEDTVLDTTKADSDEETVEPVMAGVQRDLSKAAVVAPAGRKHRATLYDCDDVDRQMLLDATNQYTAQSTAPRLPFLIFDPSSTARGFWNLLIAILLIYEAAIIPFRICFNQSSQGVWAVFEWIEDVLFVMDLLLQFRTAYPREEGSYVLVTDSNLVALRYLQTWFPIDFICVLPYERIISMTLPEGHNVAPARLPRLLRMTRMARLMRLLRLLRILRLFKSGSSIMGTVHSTKTRMVKSICAMVVGVMFMAHLSACMWFLVNDLADEDEVELGMQWALRAGIIDAPKSEQYLMSLYWALVTLTSVGYGDITPQTRSERLYCSFVMLLGVSVFGYVVGTITTMVQDANANSILYNTKMRQIHEYMQHIKLPQHLRVRVANYYDFFINRRLMFNPDKILRELSPSLRQDLVLHIVAEILDNIPFFHGRDPKFVAAAVSYLKPTIFGTGDVIVDDGVIGHEMFIITRGRVEVHSGNTILVQYGEGTYFGEIALFYRIRRTARVVAASQCELLILTRDDMDAVLEDFPEVRSQIEDVATRRYETMSSMEYECPFCGQRGHAVRDCAKAKAELAQAEKEQAVALAQEEAARKREEEETKKATAAGATPAVSKRTSRLPSLVERPTWATIVRSRLLSKDDTRRIAPQPSDSQSRPHQDHPLNIRSANSNNPTLPREQQQQQQSDSPTNTSSPFRADSSHHNKPSPFRSDQRKSLTPSSAAHRSPRDNSGLLAGSGGGGSSANPGNSGLLAGSGGGSSAKPPYRSPQDGGGGGDGVCGGVDLAASPASAAPPPSKLG